MAKYIEDKIKIDKWAPDVIVGYMKTHNMFKNDGFCSISTPTVYNAIRYGIIHVKLEDTRRMKYKPEYEHKDKNSLPASKIPYSIENRPEEINNRSTFGHFEIDTVVGTKRGKHECLLTMTERKTKFEIIFKYLLKLLKKLLIKLIKLKFL